MARLNVNPTRMEMKKLKARLDTAKRGHKLLKDKSDEMIRRFSVIIKEDKALREEVEKELAETLKQFSVARSVTSSYQAEAAFAMPSVSIRAECSTQSVMGVEVPAVSVSENRRTEGLPYTYAEVTSEADYSVERASQLIPKMLRLAEVEKNRAYARKRNRAQQEARKRSRIRYDSATRRDYKVYKIKTRRKRARRGYTAYESKIKSIN